VWQGRTLICSAKQQLTEAEARNKVANEARHSVIMEARLAPADLSPQEIFDRTFNAPFDQRNYTVGKEDKPANLKCPNCGHDVYRQLNGVCKALVWSNDRTVCVDCSCDAPFHAERTAPCQMK
jgi:hypothetical protein